MVLLYPTAHSTDSQQDAEVDHPTLPRRWPHLRKLSSIRDAIGGVRKPSLPWAGTSHGLSGATDNRKTAHVLPAGAALTPRRKLWWSHMMKSLPDVDAAYRGTILIGHHTRAGRHCRHRPDDAHHPCRHPPIASATAIRMTTLRTQAGRKRRDRSAYCAEKHRRRDRTRRFCGLIRPAQEASAIADAGQG